jgi:hypothetical protein
VVAANVLDPGLVQVVPDLDCGSRFDQVGGCGVTG